MPQTPTDIWKTELGDDWQEIYRDYLHTLGNLTLVTQEWNASLSNSPFEIKRSRLADHALRLNSQYFGEHITSWNGDSIQKRAHALIDVILDIWQAFGEPPTPLYAVGLKPTSLVVLGEHHTVNAWRDIAFHMAECVIQLTDNFNLIAEDMPSYFSREERPRRSRQLSNGWWLYVNLNSAGVVSLCDRLASYVGLTNENWTIEFESPQSQNLI